MTWNGKDKPNMISKGINKYCTSVVGANCSLQRRQGEPTHGNQKNQGQEP